MMNRSAGILTCVVMIGLICDSSGAGSRRHRRCCVPCAPVAACPPCSTASAPYGTFPDVCPQFPLYTDENNEWVWMAERHYGYDLNCSNCYVESTSLTGDYGFSTYLWPYPCGDDMCEPSTNVVNRARPNSGGKNPRYPVDMNFDPIREIPAAARARQFCPKSFYSFTDLSATPRQRFFIVYGIQAKGSQVRVGFEVPEQTLREARVAIHDATGTVFPTDIYGTPDTGATPTHSNVYLHKIQDSSADIVFFLKH